MIASGHPYQVLSPAEEDAVHRNVLRIADEVGLQVENDGLLERMAAIGGRVHRADRRVTFSPAAVEAFISESERADYGARRPRLRCAVDIYYGHYLDPRSDKFLPMTVARARDYLRVARGLPRVDSMGMLGCPLEDIPPAAEPLYERYWSWRLGIDPGGSIHRIELCPFILEMCQVHAAHTGRPEAEVFKGGVYLVPPLKLGYQEAEHVAWFLERGLRVGVGGSMATGGATAPVTLAGMVTLTIAECLLVGMLNRALYGDRSWRVWMSATALDPRTMFRPYGRPDMALANLAAAQMARRYGVWGSGHTGLSDAPYPSPEAAAQKVISTLPALMALGAGAIQAGLLAVDEVFSPVQMVLDHELTRALDQFTREYEFSDESIAADVIATVGPGGNFMAEPHTVAWLRRELWQPELWERRGFSAWLSGDRRTDVDRARERVLDILDSEPPADAICPDEARELERIIERARGRE